MRSCCCLSSIARWRCIMCWRFSVDGSTPAPPSTSSTPPRMSPPIPGAPPPSPGAEEEVEPWRPYDPTDPTDDDAAGRAPLPYPLVTGDGPLFINGGSSWLVEIEIVARAGSAGGWDQLGRRLSRPGSCERDWVLGGWFWLPGTGASSKSDNAVLSGTSVAGGRGPRGAWGFFFFLRPAPPPPVLPSFAPESRAEDEAGGPPPPPPPPPNHMSSSFCINIAPDVGPSGFHRSPPSAIRTGEHGEHQLFFATSTAAVESLEKLLFHILKSHKPRWLVCDF